jgi:AAA domain
MLTSIVNELDLRACAALDRRLILLVGGTGVGKSAALFKLIERRIAQRSAEIALRPQIVPAIYLEAESPDKGAYDFGTFYYDGLVQLKAALVERTQPVVNRRTRQDFVTTLDVERSGRSAQPISLKRRFRNELISRETELIALDEAINVFMTGRARSEKDRHVLLRDQSNKLKTLTNKTPAALVLTGAYDFYDITASSGQNARRSDIVHMEPYEMTAEGLKGFLIALIGMVDKLPIVHQLHDIASHAAEIFLQSIGCVGVAKEILTKALILAMGAQEEMTMKHVRASYYSAAQLRTMRDEISIGIKAVREVIALETLAAGAFDAITPPIASPVSALSRPPLKPGETLPSHRNGATGAW